MSTDWLVLRQYLAGDLDAVFELKLEEARIIVDLGANFGLTVALWLERAPSAQILAVEPESENFLMCSRNVDLRDAKNRVILHKAFVGGTRRMAVIDKERGEWGCRMHDTSGQPGEERASVLTMADILPPSPDEVDLLKCDIEGAESELFANCTAWISRVNYIFVEIHRPYSFGRLEGDLSNNGWAFNVLYHRSHENGANLLLEKVGKKTPEP